MPLQTDPHWEERIMSIKANNLTWGAGRILTAMEQEAVRSGQEHQGPSEATIRRILRRKWDPMKDEERKQYEYFYWPESMVRRDLPWEASSVALELLRFLDAGGWVGERPPIQFVRWFWLVSQAGPGCGIAGRIVSAAFFASEEFLGKQGLAVPNEINKIIRGVEWWLAYRPWEDENHRKSYGEAITRAENPITAMVMGEDFAFPESGSENVAELRAWMERLSGGSNSFLWYLIERMLIGRHLRSEESNG